MSAIAQNLVSQAKALGGNAKAALLQKHDDDVVVIAALRTAVTRGRKGGFKDTLPEEMLAPVLHALYSRVGLDPKLIEDVAVGNVNAPGAGASAARMAVLGAGLPNTTSANSVNRQCSSGLTAVAQIANEIRAGQIDIGIGAGAESMSLQYGPKFNPSVFSDKLMENPEVQECLTPMGITSENVASDFSIPRRTQDEFAAESFRRAAAAQKAGNFVAEIVPVTATVTDPKTGESKQVVVDKDDGIRDGVTAESLAKLKPAFMEEGSTHAGNASQVSDGAAGVLLARRSVAKRLGLPIIGKFVTAVTVGVPPRIMGVGPAYAIPKALEKTGLSIPDVDFYEINEAFASQAWYCVDKLKIPFEKVNPNGGAIALGHPLGCTGSRQLATAFAHAKRTGEKVFVTSMCMGTGMGMASVFVNEQ